MELNRAVAENIKRIRKSKKLSMERLAAEAGVSRSMLGQIERGEANPSVAIIGKLAATLKVPANLLLENDSFEPLAEYPEVGTKPVRVDGGKAIRMNMGDVATIKNSNFETKLVRLNDRSFYEVLNNKFRKVKGD